jgi:hypothetical protein
MPYPYILNVTVMDKNKTRLNLILPQALDQKLNRYALEVAKKQGKIPDAIRAKIARAALEEWLEKHENDPDAVSGKA